MAGVPLANWAAMLAANVDAEQNAHNCMSDYLCARVLSPLQLVRAVAASYPFIPDVTAIVRSTCAEFASSHEIYMGWVVHNLQIYMGWGLCMMYDDQSNPQCQSNMR
eukprot:233677-Pelagomonas_calceolata.AAC.2